MACVNTSAAAPAPVSDVLLTDRTAQALGVAVGDTLEIDAGAAMTTARRYRVAGIYRPHADPFEIGYGRLNLRMHLPDLGRTIGAGDRVDRFTLALRDTADHAAVASAIDHNAAGLRAYTATELAERGASTFVVISQFHKAIGIVSLLAGLVFLAAIMVLKVEGMRRELAVLRLLGIASRTVVRSVLAIATLVALLGSVLGIGIGLLAIACINPLARARYDTDLVFARADSGIVALAVGLSILMGVVAGGAVAWRIARSHALEQMGR
jgi:putative ABC transport system permease protein